MRTTNVVLVGVVVSVGLAGCAAPHDKKGEAVGSAKTAVKDPQSSYEPRSEPGVGQQYLARMVGDWKVEKTFFPREGQPAVSQGECHQFMIHGGRFLESDFVFHDANGDTTGTGTIGFDAESGKFTSYWIDSRSTRVSLRQSEGAFDGSEIVLLNQTVGDPGPNPRKSRTVSLLDDHDRHLLHRQWSVAADGSERLVMQLDMRRK